MNENDKRVLQHLNEKGPMITGALMTGLGLDEKSVNDSLHVLQSDGLVIFTEDFILASGAMEVITARITGDGIKLARQGYIQLPFKTATQVNYTQNIGRIESSTIIQGSYNIVNLQNDIQCVVNEFINAVDARADLDDYEREDLKRKIEELKQAMTSKDIKKFDQIKTWFSKYASWIMSVLSLPLVQDGLKKILG